MSRAIDLRVVELLAARLCHDLIGPVSAISNGVELLADEAPGFARDAVALIGDSAKKASRALQFYRFAYAFGGGALTGPAPHMLAAEFFAETATECDYRAAARALPLDQQKLACAMLALAGAGLPRGGRAGLSAGAGGPPGVPRGGCFFWARGAAGLQPERGATGPGLSPEIRAALALAVPPAELTSRTV